MLDFQNVRRATLLGPADIAEFDGLRLRRASGRHLQEIVSVSSGRWTAPQRTYLRELGLEAEGRRQPRRSIGRTNEGRRERVEGIGARCVGSCEPVPRVQAVQRVSTLAVAENFGGTDAARKELADTRGRLFSVPRLVTTDR